MDDNQNLSQDYSFMNNEFVDDLISIHSFFDQESLLPDSSEKYQDFKSDIDLCNQ